MAEIEVSQVSVDYRGVAQPTGVRLRGFFACVFGLADATHALRRAIVVDRRFRLGG
jgi:hypothetical protein